MRKNIGVAILEERTEDRGLGSHQQHASHTVPISEDHSPI